MIAYFNKYQKSLKFIDKKPDFLSDENFSLWKIYQSEKTFSNQKIIIH